MKKISSFQPPIRTLMGPGPSDVHPRILEAAGRPTIGHLDPAFIEMMDETKSLLQYAFQTENPLTIPMSAPGSVGMETCFVNLVEPGDKVIVCINGVFGSRMKENALRAGGRVVTVENAWGEPVSVEQVERALEENPGTKILAFVHAETSTGVRSDAKALCKLAQNRGCLTIVDAVTSLGGIELRVDEWGIDAIYSGSQKCLSCIPGISPVSFSEKAVKKIKSRTSPVVSWFMDLSLVMSYWDSGSKRAYHHTAPVNSLYALHESLVMLQDEGLENSWRRYQQQHHILKSLLEKQGFEFLVDEEWRLPQLNTVMIPEGVDDAHVRSKLIKDFNLEIGAGLGDLAGRVWRIGLMGFSAREENVILCASAIEKVVAQSVLH